jgi:tripartite-type tricarboxylate transporter receptor subunit TctC
MRRRSALLAGAGFGVATLTELRSLQAQEAYPSRPIRMIVPFPPGGGNDLMGRMVADRLGTQLGVPVTVDNRGGAGGLIGTEAATQSAPDGYTLLLGSISTISINPNLHARLSFDTLRDLAPVSLFAETPSALVVPASLPASTLAELIALAKAQPGQLNFASAGNGTSHHLGGELLKASAGIDIVHVPYRGSGPALTGLLGGDAQVMIAPIAAVLAMVEAGRLRALGVTSMSRSPLLPQVPTIAEAGVPDYELVLWYGIFAPARTPEPILDRLNAEVARAVESPDLRQRLSSEGASAVRSTRAELGERARTDLQRWREIVRSLPPM